MINKTAVNLLLPTVLALASVSYATEKPRPTQPAPVAQIIQYPCLQQQAKVMIIMFRGMTLSDIYKTATVNAIASKWALESDPTMPNLELKSAGLKDSDIDSIHKHAVGIASATSGSSITYGSLFEVAPDRTKEPYKTIIPLFAELQSQEYFDVPFFSINKGAPGGKRDHIAKALALHLKGHDGTGKPLDYLSDFTLLDLYSAGVEAPDPNVANDVLLRELIESAAVLDSLHIFRSKDIYCDESTSTPSFKVGSDGQITIKSGGSGGTQCCNSVTRVCTSDVNLGCTMSGGHCTLITNYCP